jgi:hypothetical protein
VAVSILSLGVQLVPLPLHLVTAEHPEGHLRLVDGRDLRVHSSGKVDRRIPTSRTAPRIILYIGDDDDCRVTLSRIVRRLENAQLVVARNAREGRLSTMSRPPDLILLDAELSHRDVRDLMVHLGYIGHPASVPVAVLSGTVPTGYGSPAPVRQHGSPSRSMSLRSSARRWVCLNSLLFVSQSATS